jgi:hypothetical protein
LLHGVPFAYRIGTQQRDGEVWIVKGIYRLEFLDANGFNAASAV